MRPTAEVGELALRVEGDGSFRGVDKLDLVLLALLEEAPFGVIRRDLLSRPLAALLELPENLLLDLRQILFADRLGELEVIVEAVLDRRADGDLHSRIDGGQPRPGDGPRSVAGRKARQGHPCHAWSGLDPLPVLEREPEILDATVHRTRTACSASLGPMARAASRPVAPSGSSSSESSGRMTFTWIRILRCAFAFVCRVW